MSIIKKLIEIQSELNAPKDLYNNFGKYAYRSAESVLLALKPLLLKHELCISINDEIEVKEGRFYVKSTVTLEDADGNSKSVTAYAREEETKKGMDGSQVTGASSSYAKKYALNNLFAIDDAKDSDATNTHGKEENKTPLQPTTSQTPPPPKEPVKPKEKTIIVVNDEKYKKAVDYLVNHKDGLKEWENIKQHYTISEMDLAQLKIEVVDRINEKKQTFK